MNIRDYTRSHTDVELREFIRNGVEWEEAGAIGDCSLRAAAERFQKEHQAEIMNESPVVWMRLILTESWRIFALRLIGMEDS